MDPFEELNWRGLVQDLTDGVRKWLASPPQGAYIGFDPTADSLHVGSLLPLLLLVRLQRFGHRVVAVVGGGTGRIGDPSGKSRERRLLDEEEIDRNVRAVRRQIERFLDLEVEDRSARVVDNGEWLGAYPLLGFLRDVGKHFSVNAMLQKESVRRRLDSEQGISFTEFSYQLLQALDFLELYDRYDVTLQAGGSDQWGNITAGIDFVRTKRGVRVEGFTFPLLTTASGAKFGKTEEGAVWLDPARTSPFRFHQFWLRSPDEDVDSLLRRFTFLDRSRIEEILAEQRRAPERRPAARVLAAEVTRLVHGAEALARAERAAEVLYGRGDLASLRADEIEEVFDDVPAAEVEAAAFEGEGYPLVDALVRTGLASSKKDARRGVEAGAVWVQDRRVGDPRERLRREGAIEGRLFVLRRGKRSRALLRVRDA